MEYVKIYVLFSFVLGFVVTIGIIYQSRSKKIREEILERHVEKGHLQKGIYGDRVVYHENDVIGETAIRSEKNLEKLEKDKPWLHILLLIVVGTIITAIIWPKVLYKYLTSNA